MVVSAICGEARDYMDVFLSASPLLFFLGLVSLLSVFLLVRGTSFSFFLFFGFLLVFRLSSCSGPFAFCSYTGVFRHQSRFTAVASMRGRLLS